MSVHNAAESGAAQCFRQYEVVCGDLAQVKDLRPGLCIFNGEANKVEGWKVFSDLACVEAANACETDLQVRAECDSHVEIVTYDRDNCAAQLCCVKGTLKSSKETTPYLRVSLKPHLNFTVLAHIRLESILESSLHNFRRRVTAVINEDFS